MIQNPNEVRYKGFDVNDRIGRAQDRARSRKAKEQLHKFAIKTKYMNQVGPQSKPGKVDMGVLLEGMIQIFRANS